MLYGSVPFLSSPALSPLPLLLYTASQQEVPLHMSPVLLGVSSCSRGVFLPVFLIVGLGACKRCCTKNVDSTFVSVEG